jgi:competence protein ComEA
MAAVVTVHVAGAVASPGVYELEPGSRVADAIEAAGGVTDEAYTDSVNLARVLADGEQVVIQNAQAAQAAAQGAGSGLVNINLADAGQLDQLPGIGPVLADRIIANRTAEGPFVTLDDLQRVSGIGPALLEKLAGAATV